MNNLAVIPARGGSQRIPRKNIKSFLGKPIMAYSIETALSSGLFTEVMVSTDDDEIASVAREYGAKVPFMRSTKNADNFATTADVLIEVINQYKAQNIEFDNACCIYPTAPLLTTSRLQEAYHLLNQHKFSTVFPVLRFGYPIQRALQISDNKVSMIWSENLNKRSQDLSPAYHDAGQFYWLRINDFLATQKLFTDNSGTIILDETDAQDIDTEQDWQLAELKYRLRK